MQKSAVSPLKIHAYETGGGLYVSDRKMAEEEDEDYE